MHWWVSLLMGTDFWYTGAILEAGISGCLDSILKKESGPNLKDASKKLVSKEGETSACLSSDGRNFSMFPEIRI